MAGYLGASPVPQTIQKKESFSASAGQTTFNTTGYTDGNFINVFLNGVRLVNGTDYTATNGSDIVLGSAAAASDVLDFETFNEFSLVDHEFTNSIALKNATHEDTDGGRESKLSFKGEQSGGEISTLAEIQGSHDGTADDQKGDLIFKTNDGSDNDAPTERMRIASDGNIGIGISPSPLTEAGGTANIQLGGTFVTHFDIDGKGTSVLANNKFYDGSNNKALFAGESSDYLQASGTHQFRTGASVSAGATATLTERMRIDNSGNLNIGSGTNVGYGPLQIGSTSGNPTVLQILSSGSSGGFVHFGDATSGSGRYSGYVQYDHASNFMAFGTSAAERMRIDSSGRVGINGSSNQFVTPLSVRSTTTSQYVADFAIQTNGYGIYLRNASDSVVGTIIMNASSTAYNTSSDYRLKENVTNISDGITRVKQLAPKRFNFIADADKTVDGFLAHEAATVVPEAVTGTKDAMKDEEYTVTAAKGDVYTSATDDADEVVHSSNVEEPDTLEEGQQWRETAEAVMGTRTVPDMQGIDQAKIVPLLTAALKEAIAKIETLESENTAIKDRLDALEAE